jgi:uncharacterized membrane protein
MYWTDPRSGRRRRAVTRDKARHTLHETENAAHLIARDLVQRSRGFLFKFRSRVRREEVDDKTLEARVRSALGRVCSHPHAIQVGVEQGRVRLAGVILQSEHPRVIARIARVRGLEGLVDDDLEVHAQPGSHPALQSGSQRPGERPEFLQHNWSPAARFVAGLGGASLLTWGLSRRGIPGLTSALLGGLLTLRSITNIELKQLTGIGGRLSIELHKDITVHAPVEEVFAFWRAMENFPRFMSHVEELRTHGADRSHWRVRGPAGVVFEWDALITRLIPHQVLAWKSVEGSTVEHAGIIHFESSRDGRSTRLDIRMSYHPPAGALGHAFALLLGVDPKRQMDDDLLRLKSLIETGKATGRETVSREQLSSLAPKGPGPQQVH